MKKYQALMIPLSIVLLSFAGGLQAKKILLWNTLDSEHAVLNSEIGPDGTIIGTDFAFESGQFGNGYVRQATGVPAIHSGAATWGRHGRNVDRSQGAASGAI